MQRLLEKAGKSIAKPVITIFIALVIGALLILPTGTSPLAAYRELWMGAFGNTVNILNSLENATPLIFTGLAATMAFKAGIFNIGIEGQMYIGAFCAALVGIYAGALPAVILIPLCLLAAMAGGLVWSIIPGILTTKYKINLVVISIMLNSVAISFTSYLCNYPFKGDQPTAQTHKLSEHAWAYSFHELSAFNAFFVLGIITAVLLYLVVFRTRFGYELRALGVNRRFTRYIGVNVNRKIIMILFISAMMAGLAGAEQVMGANHCFIGEFSADYGFTGISVALLGGLNPLGTIVGAVFFGALTNGAVQMEVMTNVSRDLISALQAIIIMLLAIEKLVAFRKNRGFLRKRTAMRKAGEVQ